MSPNPPAWIQLRRVVPSLLGCALLVLSSCRGCRQGERDGPTPPVDQHHDEPTPHATLPTRVSIRPEVAQAAGIRTQAVTAQTLPATVEIVGEVAADPDRAARVTARITGRVASVHAKEGERVRAGTLLCVLESQELLRTRAALAAAQAREKSASENASRLGSLLPNGLAARQEVVGATAESQALQAEASAAAQTLRSLGANTAAGGSRLEIRAPIDGVIVSRSATLGQTVDPMHVLFDVVDLDHAHFVGRLFEKNLALVHVGAAAEVRLNAYPQQVFVGRVENVGRQLDPMARTVVARLRIEDQKGSGILRIGLFGVARITLPDEPLLSPEGRMADPKDGGAEAARSTKKLVVPLTALSRITDRDAVFVRQPDGHFEVHPVTLGRTASGMAEILSGLRAGEQVVVDGVFTLKSALLRSTMAEDE